MKVVIAEKVSPATLKVFADEPGWQVVTHDQLTDLGAAYKPKMPGGVPTPTGQEISPP